MMNKFIEIEMTPTANGIGVSFSTAASFRQHHSTKKVKSFRFIVQRFEKMDVTNKVPYFLSYGIESGGLRHTIPASHTEKMDCTAMKSGKNVFLACPTESVCREYVEDLKMYFGIGCRPAA